MKVAVFSTHKYDQTFLDKANVAEGEPHEFKYFEAKLDEHSAPLANGSDAVCAFVNDELGRPVIEELAKRGIRLVALRCAGFNNIDLRAAKELGLALARVPAYSPQSVAEHTIALILALDRKIHKAYARVREGNFELEGLLGFNLCGRTVGVVGAGKIGLGVARILQGFGCRVLASDPAPPAEFAMSGAKLVELPDLLRSSDIISLHCPLTPQTRHLINADAIAQMKQGVMLINTSRGAVIDTKALIRELKSGRIGHVGLDVYEEEGDLFFEDLSDQMIQDDVFARLLTFPNVLITGHQAFFTEEALTAIAGTTLENLSSFEKTGSPANPISVEQLA